MSHEDGNPNRSKEAVEAIAFVEPLLKQEELVKVVSRDLCIERQKILEHLLGKWQIKRMIIVGEEMDERTFTENYKDQPVISGEACLAIQDVEQMVSYSVSLTRLERIRDYFQEPDLIEVLGLDEQLLLDVFDIRCEKDGEEVVKVYAIQDAYYIVLLEGSLFELERME